MIVEPWVQKVLLGPGLPRVQQEVELVLHALVLPLVQVQGLVQQQVQAQQAWGQA